LNLMVTAFIIISIIWPLIIFSSFSTLLGLLIFLIGSVFSGPGCASRTLASTSRFLHTLWWVNAFWDITTRVRNSFQQPRTFPLKRKEKSDENYQGVPTCVQSCSQLLY
jgi:hypothetical protein